MGRSAALALLLCGCAPLPFGETLVVVDTDVSVPRFASHLRVDLYDPGGWFRSRDVTALTAAEWPLSFSLFSDGAADKTVRVRLRAFPENGTRDYQGERLVSWPPFVEPSRPASLPDACAQAIDLPPRQETTLRYGDTRFTDRQNQGDCGYGLLSGVAVARVHIAAQGTYHFEVVRNDPDGFFTVAGDTVLFLRSVCANRSSQLACNDNIDANNGNLLSRLVTPLDAGDYFLLVGATVPTPGDATVRWSLDSVWGDFAPAGAPAGGVVTAEPRLIDASGADLTPADEPDPLASIDRLVDVPVRAGLRSTVSLLLHGECFGTQADLAGGATCVDTAGQRLPVAAAQLAGGIDRGGPSVAGTWAAEQPVPCPLSPRTGGKAPDGSALFDEEVCVPGGAFWLGDPNHVGRATVDAMPRQVVVVAPFVMDKYEFTVGRYREALRRGFVSPDPPQYLTPEVNDGPITPSFSVLTGECTFNGDASGATQAREHHPLDCVTWRTARALCQLFGGDLPQSWEWEYAAKSAGRPTDTLYSWGDQPPTCGRALWGVQDKECTPPGDTPVGPQSEEPWAAHDVNPLGLVDLVGNLDEWMADSFRPYADPCWHQNPLRNVRCDEQQPVERIVRGGAWDSTAYDVTLVGQNFEAPGFDYVDAGFRCVRR